MSNIHADDLPRVKQAVADALEGRRSFNIEYRVGRDKGEIRYVSASGHVERDEQGKPVKFVGVCQDVTLTRQSQRLEQHARELVRSNAALEEFAHVASHDLQEPLRTVTSYVELLARRYRGKLDADAEDFIGYAIDGAKRMQTLIEDLLEYSRVGSRGRPFEAVVIGRVLEDVLDGLKVNLEEAGAEVHIDGEMPTVMADQGQLRQVFQNLIVNGIKFRGENRPEIRIGVEPLGDEWRISVSDNGIGIEPRFAERVFVIFQRLHGRESFPGTGIGLAVCKRIVERHGGRIWVESKPGVGSTFYFTWPSGSVAVAEGDYERTSV
jgi:light-regulated signal transduction histidine kinase (bacteriophytochrome)